MLSESQLHVFTIWDYKLGYCQLTSISLENIGTVGVTRFLGWCTPAYYEINLLLHDDVTVGDLSSRHLK